MEEKDYEVKKSYQCNAGWCMRISLWQHVVLKKKKQKIESADDLKDAKIGVQTGTTGDIYCSDDFGDDHVERF